MAGPRIKPSDFFNLLGFPGGLNNLATEQALPTDPVTGVELFAREATNVIFRDNGKFKRRPGTTKVLDLDEPHSGHSDPSFPVMLGREAGDIIAIDAQYAKTVVASGFGDLPMSACFLNDDAYFVIEDKATGRIDRNLVVHPMGIETPSGFGAAAVTGYSLDAGKYQVSISYLRNGEEGGSGVAMVVEVGANGGIELTLPDPPDSIDTIRVWASDCNGDLLYFVEDIPAGLPSYTVADGERGKDAKTTQLMPLPQGHIIRAMNSRLIVAYGNRVFIGDAFRRGLYNPRGGFFQYKGPRIDMLEIVGRGKTATMFVGIAGNTWRLVGEGDPKKFEQRRALGKGVVPGTSRVFPGDVFGRSEEEVAYWIAKDGTPCLGLPGGGVELMTDDKFVMPEAECGATGLQTRDGTRTVVTSLKGGEVSRMAVADTAEVFQYRNGILID